ncbi:hypothetical protein [Bradyrhizobium sp. USDA 4353]
MDGLVVRAAKSAIVSSIFVGFTRMAAPRAGPLEILFPITLGIAMALKEQE